MLFTSWCNFLCPGYQVRQNMLLFVQTIQDFHSALNVIRPTVFNHFFPADGARVIVGQVVAQVAGGSYRERSFLRAALVEGAREGQVVALERHRKWKLNQFFKPTDTIMVAKSPRTGVGPGFDSQGSVILFHKYCIPNLYWIHWAIPWWSDSAIYSNIEVHLEL